MRKSKARFPICLTDAEAQTWRRLARERGVGGCKLASVVGRILCADAALLDGIVDGYPMAVSGAGRQRAILRHLAAQDERAAWLGDLSVEFQLSEACISVALRAMEVKGLVRRWLAPRQTHKGVYPCARVALTPAGVEAAEALE